MKWIGFHRSSGYLWKLTIVTIWPVQETVVLYWVLQVPHYGQDNSAHFRAITWKSTTWNKLTTSQLLLFLTVICSTRFCHNKTGTMCSLGTVSNGKRMTLLTCFQGWALELQENDSIKCLTGLLWTIHKLTIPTPSMSSVREEFSRSSSKGVQDANPPPPPPMLLK